MRPQTQGSVTAAFFADHFAFTERLAKVRINPGNQVHPGWLDCIHAESGIERFKTELIKSASRVASPLPWSVARLTRVLARAGHTARSPTYTRRTLAPAGVRATITLDTGTRSRNSSLSIFAEGGQVGPGKVGRECPVR